MPQKPIFQFGVRSAILRLRRFAGRYVLPFVIRPFEGAAEERPLTHGLKQIAATLGTMGVLPEDSIVRQIGSEFRVLFCAPALSGNMKPQARGGPIDPVKTISDLLREPPRTSYAAAALRRFIA